MGDFSILELREFMSFMQGCEFRIRHQCYSISHHRKYGMNEIFATMCSSQ